MRIEYLADHIDHVPVLAKWFHDQWGHLDPDRSIEDGTERLYSKANRDKMPITFVAIDGDRPIGSASLVECDMDTRAHLKPWLASVYVDAQFRTRGIGSSLVRRVVDEARVHGFSILYLWTPDKAHFYSTLGWTVIEETSYLNETVTVMSISL